MSDPILMHELQQLASETDTDTNTNDIIYSEPALGDEPPLLHRPSEKKPVVVQPPHVLTPNVQAASWGLLAWCVVLLIFIASFIAIRLHGLFCPEPPNNTTQIKLGSILANANFSANPCTDFWQYACGSYSTSHINTSVLSQMQTTHVARLTPTLQSLAASYLPYTDSLVNSSEIASSLGWFTDYTVDILPDYQSPVRYALYLTQDTMLSATLTDYVECLPTALPCTSSALFLFVTTHNTVPCYMLVNYSAPCSPVSALTKAHASYQSLSLLAQLVRFWPRTIGAAFAATLPPHHHEMLLGLCGQIRSAALTAVRYAQWLDAPSRANAVNKLEALEFFVGYNTISPWECTAHSFVDCELQRQTHTLTLLYSPAVPADSGWSLSAIDVNAYYVPFFNAIYLPYGITTMPLYSSQLPTPYNIAGLGAILAHEIGHAIDPTGVDFNALGQYRPWLSSQAQHSMTQVETCLTTLYNFTDNPLHTLNENFADTFSVLVLQQLAPHPSSEMAPRQFWLDWAQTWCKISTHLAPNIPFPPNTDVHAQARYRIKGMVAQNPALAHAYTCPVHTACLDTI